MKTIGMLGGNELGILAVYYRILNREVQKRLGGIHSAKTLMHSCDFAEMAALQGSGRWDEAHDQMSTIAVNLAKSGADFLIICCNTMHTAAEQMERAARIPLLHIADPLGEALKKAGVKRPALLGSRHTMERDDVLQGPTEVALRHRSDDCRKAPTRRKSIASSTRNAPRGQFLEGFARRTIATSSRGWWRTAPTV